MSAEGKEGITQESETKSISRKSLDKLMILALGLISFSFCWQILLYCHFIFLV